MPTLSPVSYLLKIHNRKAMRTAVAKIWHHYTRNELCLLGSKMICMISSFNKHSVITHPRLWQPWQTHEKKRLDTWISGYTNYTGSGTQCLRTPVLIYAGNNLARGVRRETFLSISRTAMTCAAEIAHVTCAISNRDASNAFRKYSHRVTILHARWLTTLTINNRRAGHRQQHRQFHKDVVKRTWRQDTTHVKGVKKELCKFIQFAHTLAESRNRDKSATFKLKFLVTMQKQVGV